MEPIDTTLFGTVHRAKKTINQKRKGNVNELVVTKLLTDWTGHEFVRVPMSGGLRWKNRMDICGDVINTDHDFEFIFSVETKHVASLGIQLNHPKDLRLNSVVHKYFAQCQRDADASGKQPFLMVRQNGMPDKHFYIFLQMTPAKRGVLNAHIKPLLWSTLNYTLAGYRSEDLFKNVPYETLKYIMK